MKPKDRANILHRIGDLIDKYAVELAELDVLDEGSPWGVTKDFYIALSADHFRYFSGWATKVGGETLPVNMGGEWLAYTTREPIGVVGQILPWNVPMLMAAWKVSPALAAGCPVVVKAHRGHRGLSAAVAELASTPAPAPVKPAAPVVSPPAAKKEDAAPPVPASCSS